MQAGGGAGWRAAFFNIAALSYYVHKINYEWQTVCFKYGKEKISEFKSLERASVCVCVCVCACVCVLLSQLVGQQNFPTILLPQPWLCVWLCSTSHTHVLPTTTSISTNSLLGVQQYN